MGARPPEARTHTLPIGGPGAAPSSAPGAAAGVAPCVPRQSDPLRVIAGLGVALPAGVETIEEIEARIERESGRLPVPRGTLAAISGIRSRRAVGPGEYASTLAAGAARCALEDAGTKLADIDLLLFASTSQDQVEPATAHNVARELGYRGGSAFDVKNACNSFVEGIRVAEAMLATGAARRALVVTGETPTLAARYAVADRRAFRHAFIGYTVGDVGGAVVLEPSPTTSAACSTGDSWSASAALGRVDGPRRRVAPPARRRVHLYAGGDGGALRDIVRAFDPVDRDPRVRRHRHDARRLRAVHRPPGHGAVRRRDDRPPRLPAGRASRGRSRRTATWPRGRCRSRSACARDAGRVRRGDNVLFVGLGAGISVATMAIRL